MPICYLGIGSNLGDRRKNIRKALIYLKKTKGIKVVKISSIYETKPVGGPPQNKFLNAAIKIKTTLEPLKLLKTLKRIEKELGRKKTLRFGPRIIDLDILLYADKVIDRKDLKIPHPKMFKRKFVLMPLIELI